MKGVVFTEFIDMVEVKFDANMVENVIDDAGVDGIYTAIGTYPHSDMIKLVSALSVRSDIEVSELLRIFGVYMFDSFTRLYPSFFDKIDNAFDFLDRVEDYIHVEVKKIYPQAELPRFETKRLDDKRLEMIYYSDRRMGAFAIGLIQGSLTYFKNEGEVRIVDSKEDDAVVNFLIEMK